MGELKKTQTTKRHADAEAIPSGDETVKPKAGLDIWGI